MTERLSVNNSPLNQAAKQLLLKAGLETAVQYPYSIQLALEGLDSKNLNPTARKYREDMKSMAHRLMAGDPQRATRYVTNPACAEDDLEWAEEQVVRDLDGLEPSEAEEELAGNLWSSLGADYPYLFGPCVDD